MNRERKPTKEYSMFKRHDDFIVYSIYVQLAKHLPPGRCSRQMRINIIDTALAYGNVRMASDEDFEQELKEVISNGQR